MKEKGVNFSYCLHCQDKKDNKNEYFFPFNQFENVGIYESKKGNEKIQLYYMNYEFEIEGDTSLRLMLDISTEPERFEQHKFHDYFSKLLYEVLN